MFLFGVASSPLSPLSPLSSPSSSSSRSPGNGRNFKRKFTNEGDFPSPPPTIQRPTLGCNAEGKEREGGKSRHAVVFRAFSTPASTVCVGPVTTFLEYLSLFPFFFYFSRTRRGLVQWKSRKGRERGRRTPSKRERPPREEMRFSSFPRAFQSALSCPRCANVSIHPLLADFPLTPRRKPQSGSHDVFTRSAWIFFPSLP